MSVSRRVRHAALVAHLPVRHGRGPRERVPRSRGRGGRGLREGASPRARGGEGDLGVARSLRRAARALHERMATASPAGDGPQHPQALRVGDPRRGNRRAGRDQRGGRARQGVRHQPQRRRSSTACSRRCFARSAARPMSPSRPKRRPARVRWIRKAEVRGAMGLFKAAASILKRGLARTAEALVGLRAFLAGRRIDESLLAEIEKRLLAADVGVKASRKLVEALRRDWLAGRISTGEEVVPFLKGELRRRWEGVELSLARSEQKPTVILVVGVNGSGKTTSVGEDRREPQGRRPKRAACRRRHLPRRRDRAARDLVGAARGRSRQGRRGRRSRRGRLRCCAGGGRTGRGRAPCRHRRQAAYAGHPDASAHQDPRRRREADQGSPHEVLLVLDATAGQNAIRRRRSSRRRSR